MFFAKLFWSFGHLNSERPLLCTPHRDFKGLGVALGEGNAGSAFAYFSPLYFVTTQRARYLQFLPAVHFVSYSYYLVVTIGNYRLPLVRAFSIFATGMGMGLGIIRENRKYVIYHCLWYLHFVIAFCNTDFLIRSLHYLQPPHISGVDSRKDPDIKHISHIMVHVT